MEKNLVAHLHSAFLNPIDKFTTQKWWRMKSVIVLTILSFVFSTGAFFYLPTAFTLDNWKSFNFKKENLFKQPPFSEESHAAKKTFRITVPLIAKTLHLNNWLTVAFIWICNCLFLYFSILLFEKLLTNKVAALLGTFALTFIYVGHAGFTDINTWFDGVAYLLLLIACLSTSHWLIFLSIILACFTDERAYLSSMLVLLFHFLEVRDAKFLSNLKTNKKAIFTFLGVATALALRLLIQIKYNLHTLTGGTTLDRIMNDSDFWGMAVWTHLEGFWLLLLLVGIILLQEKKYTLTSLLFLIVAAFSCSSFLIFDKTRSGAYIFPIIFIGISLLKNKLKVTEWNYLFLLIAIICFLFPSYYVISDTAPYTHWYKPVFIRVLDLIIK